MDTKEAMLLGFQTIQAYIIYFFYNIAYRIFSMLETKTQGIIKGHVSDFYTLIWWRVLIRREWPLLYIIRFYSNVFV